MGETADSHPSLGSAGGASLEGKPCAIESGPTQPAKKQFALKWTIGMVLAGVPVAWLLYFSAGPVFPREAGPNTRLLYPETSVCRFILVAVLEPQIAGTGSRVIRLQLDHAPLAPTLRMDVQSPGGSYWISNMDEDVRSVSGPTPLTKEILVQWLHNCGIGPEAQDLGTSLYGVVERLNANSRLTVAQACEDLGGFRVSKVATSGLPARWVLPVIVAFWTTIWAGGIVWGQKRG